MKPAPIEIKFRTKLLEPVIIDISFIEVNQGNPSCTAFVQFKDEEKKYGFILVFDRLIFANCNEEERVNRKEHVSKEIAGFAKWYVLNGNFRDWNMEILSIPVQSRDEYTLMPEVNARKIIFRRYDHSDEKYDFLFDDRNNHFEILYPPLRNVYVEEHLLGRKIVLERLYQKSASMTQLIQDSHFPDEIISRELKGLLESGYIRYVTHAEDIYDLTHKGFELFEKMKAKQSGIAFIIAACISADRQFQGNIIETYKKAARSFGLDPKFQESEEPHKNIHIDIFDYISSCDVVIADLTYERLNCYIEIGYAMALQKPILMFVEKDWLAKWKEEHIPFDISVVKYQEYSRQDLPDLEKKCAERVKTILNRQNAR